MARAAATPEFPWVGAEDEVYRTYMAEEWGVPVHDDRRLFEMLTLELFQSGLSWSTILHRRAGFRRAFHRWSLKRIAAMGEGERSRLLQDAGIIRNRRKIAATIQNANSALTLKRQAGSLDAFFWGFVGGAPIRPPRPYLRWEDLPATSEVSHALAKELKARGFVHLGPTTLYAFMQAVGLVDDRLGHAI